MHSLLISMRYVNALLFIVLAVLSIQHWRRRRSSESAWVAASLGTMATIAGVGYFLPSNVDSGPLAWVQKALVVLLILFPYLLYRFAAAFDPPGRALDRAAAGLTIVVGALTLVISRFPAPGEPWPPLFAAYVAILLVQWILLSTVTAVRLWRGGAGKTSVARRRMRTLSTGSTLIILALLLAVGAQGADQETTTTLFVQFLALGAAALFYAGVAPPILLRRLWRRREERLLQRAQLGLMAATTPEEVTAPLLPHVAGVLGGWAAALVDESGRTVGATGVDDQTVRKALDFTDDQVVRLRFRSGSLLIWTDAYSPYFGPEELQLLESFTVMVDLALARCDLIEAQRLAAEHLAETNAELAQARDEAMESSRLKSEFLATMSHEIRTPMNGVIGLTDLLLRTELDARQQQFAQGVKGAGEALLAIINDILDFSKIEADRLVLESVDFDPSAVIEEAADLVREAARAKNLNLGVSIAEDVPAVLRGDPSRLRQVLLNLIANAVKFTERGGVSVRALKIADAGSAVVVHFEVEDTGIGILAEDRERLFEPFSQADSSTTRRFGGTGLGLAISRELVVLMGGEIGLDSEPGRGSRFWFDLPLERVEEATSSVPVTPVPVPDPMPKPSLYSNGSRGRVLVVEDNRVNQLVAVATVENLGFSVDVAENGLQALDSVARASYAAVLMDCQMPEMDGYAATREIRLREGTARHVPVIAMTAAAMEGDRERCLEAGMDDYVSKPIRADEVDAALSRWIEEAPRTASG